MQGGKESQEAARYKASADGLKTTAVSISYGIFCEVNTDEETKINKQERLEEVRKRRWYYCGHRLHKAFSRREENAGKFYCPIISTLVTSGSHLLQAMLDSEARDRGLIPAYMDTDSYFFGRNKDRLTREEFAAEVREIKDKVQRLSPYKPGIELLKIEAEGDALITSAKRYIVYRTEHDPLSGVRKIISVKVSAHGLGGYVPPDDYEALVPMSEEELKEMGVHQWIVDVWTAIIQKEVFGDFELWQALGDKLRGIPARAQVTMSTWRLFEYYRKFIPGLKPFDFVFFRKLRVDPNVRLGHYFENVDALVHFKHDDMREKDVEIPLTIPIDSEGITLDRSGYKIGFETLWGKVSNYSNHPDVKISDPNCIGRTEKKSVRLAGRGYIGKETSSINPDTDEEDAILHGHGYYSCDVKYSPSAEPHVAPKSEEIERPTYVSYKGEIEALLAHVSLRELARVSEIGTKTLQAYRDYDFPKFFAGCVAGKATRHSKRTVGNTKNIREGLRKALGFHWKAKSIGGGSS